MVSYQTWTSIAFDVARSKGASFSNLAEGGDFVSNVVAPLWDQHDELKTATRAEAQNLAERRITA